MGSFFACVILAAAVFMDAQRVVLIARRRRLGTGPSPFPLALIWTLCIACVIFMPMTGEGRVWLVIMVIAYHACVAWLLPYLLFRRGERS